MMLESIRKAFDYRYVYLLTRKRNKVVCTMAVRIPYAERKEKWLHEKFDEDRFVMTKLRRMGYNPLTDQCKIGITNNLPRRLGDINADKLSGRTEWFEFSIFQKWGVMALLSFYWLAWNVTVVTVMCIAALFLLSVAG